jgi:tRNA(fMet)-specific endonuclease VapC
VTRYLLDSGIASALINRRGLVPSRVRAARLRGDRIGLSTPVLGELIGGIQNSTEPDRNMALLWRAIAQLALWTFDRAAAIEFGKTYAQLRRAGRIIQIPDIQSAAIAASLGNCTIVSKDNDFRAISGLSVEDWSQS